MQYIMLCIFKTVDPTQPSRSVSPSPFCIIPTPQPSPTSNAIDDRGLNLAAVALGCLFAITLLILIVTILVFVVLLLKKNKRKPSTFASNPGNVLHTNNHIHAIVEVPLDKGL